jgi:hypothetical protein
MSQNHVKMGGVGRADSTPDASATPRQQYIALKQIGNTTKWGEEKVSSQVPMELWLLWRPPWLNAIFVSGSFVEKICRIALKGSQVTALFSTEITSAPLALLI